jgi:hypothetical protein
MFGSDNQVQEDYNDPLSDDYIREGYEPKDDGCINWVFSED